MSISRRVLLASFGANLLAPGRLRAQVASSQMHPRISLSDFGGRPGADDAGPVLKVALQKLPKTGGATLHIPPASGASRRRRELSWVLTDLRT
jgi:hypothetical protein